jgi:putative toxin-antitoxin system antitoxin component (TIGR02293 family)
LSALQRNELTVSAPLPTTVFVAEKSAVYAPSGAKAADDARHELEVRTYARSRSYLGGRTFSRGGVSSRVDVHAAIVKGVPYGSLVALVSQLNELDEGDICKVLGISTRTLRRQTQTPDKAMPPDLASKAWLLAETLAKATEVFGGIEDAQRWMSRPAMGLNGQRPIDLLETIQGAELVTDFLTRLEHGVYS